MRKEKLYRLLSAVCAFTIMFSAVELFARADAISGKTASTYAYILNDFMAKYGTVTQEGSSDYFDNPDGIALNGVYYSDVVDFDNDGNSYLVIFTLDSVKRSADANIWKYDGVADMPVEVAKLSKSYADLPPDISGEFYIGYNDEKRYISYKEHQNDSLITNEYYTVIDGDAFMYVNTPQNVEDVGIMSFNSTHFHSGIDISGYNKQLDDFFMRLKNGSADSVTLEDMADYLRSDDEERVEKTLSRAVGYRDFDIINFSSMDSYLAALKETQTTDRFYLITNMYNLGDEIYYVRFSTDHSFYNYTVLRRSDKAPDGYQILKVRTDCIPLSDRELEQIKQQYARCTLLMKKSHGRLKKASEAKPLVSKFNLPRVEIEKQISRKWRVPAALVGSGVSLGLMVLLWFILLKDE